jgi:hypothetical protein
LYKICDEKKRRGSLADCMSVVGTAIYFEGEEQLSTIPVIAESCQEVIYSEVK